MSKLKVVRGQVVKEMLALPNGGAGSGNFGHAGVKGQRGGSAKGVGEPLKKVAGGLEHEGKTHYPSNKKSAEGNSEYRTEDDSSRIWVDEEGKRVPDLEERARIDNDAKQAERDRPKTPAEKAVIALKAKKSGAGGGSDGKHTPAEKKAHEDRVASDKREADTAEAQKAYREDTKSGMHNRPKPEDRPRNEAPKAPHPDDVQKEWRSTLARKDVSRMSVHEGRSHDRDLEDYQANVEAQLDETTDPAQRVTLKKTLREVTYTRKDLRRNIPSHFFNSKPIKTVEQGSVELKFCANKTK